MSATPLARLLIVDDESAQLKSLCDVLTVEGFATTGFTSAKAALQRLREEQFDLLLTDLMMAEMNGIALLGEARGVAPDIVSIVMTGHAAIDTAVMAMQAGAIDYIVKPFKLKVILPVIERALAVRRLRLENKRLEQNVRDRTRDLESANRQLEAANRELETFSYSVSHDLRAPLRTIHGFCRIYMEDYKTTIPPEGMPLLQRVLAGAERMDQLTEDLLALSRLGRQEIHKRRVQLKDIAQHVIDELRARDPERQIEIRLGDLDACDGDPSLLEQVLVNLLSNAFKFSANSTAAIVEVSCRTSDEGPVYSVRDNGAGFDMKYADKLFGIFQRLHSDSEFAGTGVGLSIVQRIIHRHGGRIWAESEPGKGAAFHFTIPSDSQAARAVEPSS